MSQAKPLKKEKTKTKLSDSAVIIVFNDDENSFEWVIESFIEICSLSIDEAIQKTFLIHNTGQSKICEGEYSKMKKMKDKLVKRTIKAIVSRPDLN